MSALAQRGQSQNVGDNDRMRLMLRIDRPSIHVQDRVWFRVREADLRQIRCGYTVRSPPFITCCLLVVVTCSCDRGDAPHILSIANTFFLLVGDFLCWLECQSPNEDTRYARHASV